ncbi:MAG: 30S ribosomal protein S20 [bacterium]
MPIQKASFKDLRKIKKRVARNKKVKNELDFFVKKLKKALIANQPAEAKEWLAKAIQKLDKAAGKKIIKKNAANRRKSRLTKKLNQLLKP